MLALLCLCDTGPNMCDNKHNMVIATHIRHWLSSIEREVTLIVTYFWPFFSHIFGETVLAFNIYHQSLP